MMPAVKFAQYNLRRLGLTLLLPSMFMGAIAVTTNNKISIAQTANPAESSPLTVRSDIQEADQRTGVITARGNVQLFYPSRQIQATAAQAQYFSRERRIILTGNVYVLQSGNSIRGEQIVYLIDEGRFIAVPQANRQVESIYLVSDPNQPAQATPPPRVPTTTNRPQSNNPSRGR
jgi:lipopolysaccharide export system protein LptA